MLSYGCDFKWLGYAKVENNLKSESERKIDDEDGSELPTSCVS